MNAKKIISASIALATLFCSTAFAGDLDVVRKNFKEASLVSYSPDSIVTQQFIKYSAYGVNAIDVLLMQLYLSVQLPENEVDRVVSLFKDGQWTDIDYTDMGRGQWLATLHVTRIYALAKAYASESSPYYKDAEVGKVVHEAMAWWFREMPLNPNWWHNVIGVPKKFIAAMLMIRDELSEEEIQGGLKVLARTGFGNTGQNKAWQAGIQLMKGLLIDDEALVAEARKQIGEEIFITEAEGVQPDWSFHQHGPQLQFGNYGLAYAEGVSFWVRVLEGSKYAFTPEQYDIVGNLILNGLGWTVWKGFMDPSFCGRQLHIDGGRGKAYSLAVAAQNMAATAWGDKKALNGMSNRDVLLNISETCLRPDKYENELTGARYFWRSDCGIYRTRDWYASIRMQSERTIGFEYTNEENLLANFSADGALLLMQSGTEYENIFGYWDWRKLPGVTAYDDGQPIPCYRDEARKRNNSQEVFGKTDEDIMVTSMELDRDGLHAQKANFFFPDVVVALGADITCTKSGVTNVTTALDQTKLVGETVIEKGNGWAWHDSKGYISLDGSPLVITTAEQEGSWEPLAPCYKGVIDRGHVFKCWLEHKPGTEPQTYAYALLPTSTAKQTAKFAKYTGKSRGIKILRNDADIQAIEYQGTTCAVIHTPGTWTIGSRTVTADAAGAFVWREHNGH